jgi:hypothetical protein
MSRLIACGIACAAALTVSINAQYPAQPQPAPSAQKPASQDQPATSGQMVTVEGCLFKEKDVPGRKPPEAEQSRVNRDNDFVLANTKMIKGSAPSMATSPRSDEKPAGTSGVVTSGLVFKVEEIDLGQLEQHAGQRVQIDGTLQHLDRAKAPVSPGNELVKLRGTALRKVAGDCPRG